MSQCSACHALDGRPASPAGGRWQRRRQFTDAAKRVFQEHRRTAARVAVFLFLFLLPGGGLLLLSRWLFRRLQPANPGWMRRRRQAEFARHEGSVIPPGLVGEE